MWSRWGVGRELATKQILQVVQSRSGCRITIRVTLLYLLRRQEKPIPRSDGPRLPSHFPVILSHHVE
jgi:hypothetical protein